MSGTLRERAFHCNAYELKHDFGPVLMQQMVRMPSSYSLHVVMTQKELKNSFADPIKIFRF